jgi:hypothetical protein
MLKKLLKQFRHKLLGNKRENLLSSFFFQLVNKNIKDKKINILDYGSGYNPDLISYLSKKLDNDNIDFEITCADFYSEQNLVELNMKYEKISFTTVDGLSKNITYDFIVISDVLHHVGVKSDEILDILENLSTKTEFIILKDHFEYSLFSRQILRFMDFIGNYKDGVNIPDQYFTKIDYYTMLNSLNIEKVAEIKNIKLYGKIFIPFNFSKYQFIHLLKKSH